VDTVVVSAQHSEDISTEKLREEIKEKIIKEVIPANMLDDKTVYHVSALRARRESLSDWW
jgi:S-adenosylmethionine synthetase